MPIYEYRCSKCGHELEVIQKISEAPLTLCPSCGSESLQKLVSAASFRLKGGGWYETDFKKGNKKHLADGTDGSAADSAKEGSKDSSKEGGKESDSGSANRAEQGKATSGQVAGDKGKSPGNNPKNSSAAGKPGAST